MPIKEQIIKSWREDSSVGRKVGIALGEFDGSSGEATVGIDIPDGTPVGNSRLAALIFDRDIRAMTRERAHC